MMNIQAGRTDTRYGRHVARVFRHGIESDFMNEVTRRAVGMGRAGRTEGDGSRARQDRAALVA